MTPPIICKHIYLYAISLEMIQNIHHILKEVLFKKFLQTNRLKNFNLFFKLRHSKDLFLKIHQSVEQQW